MHIHYYAEEGDIEGVKQALARRVPVDKLNSEKMTPLMVAVASTQANLDMVQFLLANGADAHKETIEEHHHLAAGHGAKSTNFIIQKTVLRSAITGGNYEKIKLIVDAGADVKYISPHGYSALLDSMYGKDIRKNEDLVEVIKLLLKHGAASHKESDYKENAINAAASNGRFDVVKLLLQTGVQPQTIGWSKLILALIYGDIEQVQKLLDDGADLQSRDIWQQTPIQLSVLIGNLEKAKLLHAYGADLNEKNDKGQSPLSAAIIADQAQMVAWLIDEGVNFQAPHKFSEYFEATPLHLAIQYNSVDCVQTLLNAGTNPDQTLADRGPTVEVEHLGIQKLMLEASIADDRKLIAEVEHLGIAKLMLEAGINVNNLNGDMQHQLFGFTESKIIDVSEKAYLSGKSPRFGKHNPEKMNVPFWQAMVRCGQTAYFAKMFFHEENCYGDPAWCNKRFGQSITQLPNGRFISIAGEHEDFDDPNFYIYNDVIVYHKDGTFDIYGYPKTVFPPTDFHTATLVGNYIYIIGNLSYMNERTGGETSVFRLNYESWQIEKVITTGTNPGWICKHSASLIDNETIYISEGSVWKKFEDEYSLLPNTKDYALNLNSMEWRQI